MKPLTFTLLVLLGCCAALHAQTTAQPVRLAVIVESASLATAADLLTVELSRSDKVALLERAQISKVLSEQALTAGNGSRDYLKLGEILGAEGLVIMELGQKAGRAVLSSRLVAVKPGVALALAEYEFPLKDSTAWSKLIATQFEPLYPKLGVLKKDAVPISLVGLRSAVKSAETESLERAMNALLQSRLMHEREVFVLERQKLNKLAEEKEYKGLEGTTFWNGSYLLEGVIDRDGYNRETVTVNARMTAPGKPPAELEVKGRREELAAVINELAAKVLKELNKSAAVADWKPADEARRYQDEAGWALKWGMLDEAQAASESAWALGLKTRETASIRVQSYLEQSKPSVPSWVFHQLQDPEVVRRYPPNPEKLASAIRAHQLFNHNFHVFLADESKPDMLWNHILLGLLYSSADLLQHFYGVPTARTGHDEQLTELRSLGRDTIKLAQGHPGYAHLARDPKYVGIIGNLAEVLVEKGGYFYETPSDALVIFRAIHQDGLLAKMRLSVTERQLANWTQTDTIRLSNAWKVFIDELCSSTNAPSKVEGYFQACAASDFHVVGAEPMRKLFEVMIENAMALDSVVPAYTYPNQLLQDIDLLAARKNNVLQSNGNLVPREDLQNWKTEFNRALRIAQTQKAKASIKAYILKSDNEDINPVEYLVGTRFDFTPADAQDLLDLLGDYRERLHANPGPRLRLNATYPAYVSNKLDELEGKIRPLLSINRPAAPRTMPPAVDPVLVRASNQVARLMTNETIRVTRIWKMPFPPLERRIDFGSYTTVVKAMYREGRVWIEVNNRERAFIFGLDLEDFSAEAIEFPYRQANLKSDFEVLGGNVYISDKTNIHRYALRTKSWEKLSAPVHDQVHFSLAGARLFASTSDSILEILSPGDEVRIIASARRRPPLTSLDTLDSLRDMVSGAYPRIGVGSNDSVRILARENLYEWSERSNDWARSGPVPAAGINNSFISTDGGFLLTQSVDRRVRVLHLGPTNGTPELLLSDRRTMYLPTPAFVNQRAGETNDRPAFGWPRGLGIEKASFCLDGRTLWALVGGLRIEGSTPGVYLRRDNLKATATLLAFERQLDGPCALPITFDVPDDLLDSEVLGSLNSSSRLMEMVPTPQGLVCFSATMSAVWVFERSVFEPCLQAARTTSAAAKGAERVARENQLTNLQSKYQFTNYNAISPAERELMVDDPAFLSLQLPEIDRNGNENLDLAELAYFDADGDGVLNSREEAGILAACRLLAARIIRELDMNSDGVLDASELPRPGMLDERTRFVFPQLSNPKSQYDVDEMQAVVQQVCQGQLVAANRRGSPASGFQRGTMGVKALVESYWKNSGNGNAEASRGQPPRSP